MLFEISGQYKDWGKLTHNSIVFHDGNIIGILTKENDEVVLTINYGTKTNYSVYLKKYNQYYFTIPKYPEYLNRNYVYIPFILEEKEFLTFFSKIYANVQYSTEISNATKKDFLSLWLCTNKYKDSYTTFNEMKKQMLSNIVAFSEEEEYLKILLEHIDVFDYEPISYKNTDAIEIVLYYQYFDFLYEWYSIVKINGTFALKITDIYAIALHK